MIVVLDIRSVNMVCLDMNRQVAGLVHLQKHRSQSLILTDFCGSPGLRDEVPHRSQVPQKYRVDNLE